MLQCSAGAKHAQQLGYHAAREGRLVNAAFITHVFEVSRDKRDRFQVWVQGQRAYNDVGSVQQIFPKIGVASRYFWAGTVLLPFRY